MNIFYSFGNCSSASSLTIDLYSMQVDFLIELIADVFMSSMHA